MGGCSENDFVGCFGEGPLSSVALSDTFLGGMADGLLEEELAVRVLSVEHDPD